MSEARDLYLECFRSGLLGPGNAQALQNLRRAADLWRRAGQHFSAGVAMSSAVHAAWGWPDQMAEVQRAALVKNKAVYALARGGSIRPKRTHPCRMTWKR